MNPTTEVLERKRRELELEILAFKNKKEDEYRDFQRQYIPDIGGIGGIGGVTISSGDDLDMEKHNTLSAEQNLLHREGSNFDRIEAEAFKDSEHTRKARVSNGETPQSPAIQGDNINMLDHAKDHRRPLDKAQLHERELEFQGLFTPNFLPLLDGNSSKDTALRSGQGLNGKGSAMSTLGIEDVLPGSGDRQINRGFSSSASSASFSDTHHPPSLSPPPVRPLSASVPRQPSHQRRSSSRSDTSATSLRSSLRDPQQPRSPKRVLFSIGDKVVSPSTSPLMQRANADSSGMPPKLVSAPPTAGRVDLGPASSQSHAWDMFPWSKTPSSIASIYGTASASSKAMSSPTRSGAASDAIHMINWDEFERIDNDDELFAFDEDVTIGRSNDEEEGRLETGLGSDGEEDVEEPLPASSPHAGSLPIEIKWPAKYASNG